MKIRCANRESLRALCLLSTFTPASRRCRVNVAAYLGSQGHFFVVASYCFEGGFARDRHSRPAAAHSNQGSNPEHPQGRREISNCRSHISDGIGCETNQRTGRVPCSAMTALQGACLGPVPSNHHRWAHGTHGIHGSGRVIFSASVYSVCSVGKFLFPGFRPHLTPVFSQ